MIRPRHPRQTLSQSRCVPSRAPSNPALFLPRATRAMRPFPFSPLLRNSFVCLSPCFVPSGRTADLACPLSHLDATFTSYRVSVENKGLTGRLSRLDATFTKNRGGYPLTPLVQNVTSPPTRANISHWRQSRFRLSPVPLPIPALSGLIRVAVPRFPTTIPAATLASRAAVSRSAPAATVNVKALMAVSPAPVTS